MKQLLIAFVCFAFLFIGCGHKINNGVIIEKHWHNEFYIYGKTVQYFPPRYCVQIQGVKNKDTLTSTYSIYLHEWMILNVGDSISFK